MRAYFIVIIFITVLMPLHVCAQDDREDVIYLKNGSVYRGTIIEQVPNVRFKIEIAGGNVILINAADVIRITKEKKFVDKPIFSAPGGHVYEFHYRPRTWFIEVQGLGETVEIGFRLMGGYKFNQFGILALGTGLDVVMCDLHGKTNYDGEYVPLYIYYSGEILRRPTTPFYSVEAGYAFVPSSGNSNDVAPSYNNALIGQHGGFMGGAGFGVRFYSRRRIHFDLSAHIDFKMATVHYGNETYNQNTGNYEYYYYSTSDLLIIPGLRFGVGF